MTQETTPSGVILNPFEQAVVLSAIDLYLDQHKDDAPVAYKAILAIRDKIKNN